MRALWLAVALTLGCYLPTIDAGFVYDDYPYIVDNADLRGGAERLPELFAHSFPSFAPERGLYRPLASVTLWLDRAGGALDPRRHHVTNLTLAVLLVIAVHALLRRVAGESAAGLGALLFAVHPVHVEAIAWVSGRAEVLAAIFVCVALAQGIAFVRDGRARSIAVSAAAVAAGILSKENGAVALPLWLGWWAVAGRRESRGRAGTIAGVFLAATAVVLLARHAALDGFAPAPAERAGGVGREARAALAVAATGEHLRLLVWPHPLSIERMPEPPANWRGPVVWWGLATIVAWGGAIAFSRNARRFLLLWPLVALLPVMHVVPIGATVAERFVLLPSVGLCGWAGSVAAASWRTPRRVIVAAVVIAGAFLTIARANLWRDEERLWEDAARRQPLSAKAWAGWGDAARHGGRAMDAITRYEKALEIAPGMTAVRQTLAAAYGAVGREDLALEEARRAVESDGTDPVALNNLGARLARAGRIEEADVLYQRAIAAAPRYAPALRNAALAALELGRRDEAAALLERAAAVDPSLPGLVELRERMGSTPGRPDGR